MIAIPVSVYVQGYLGWCGDNLAPCPTCCLSNNKTELALVNKKTSLLFCPKCKSLHKARFSDGAWYVTIKPEKYAINT